MLGMTEPFIPNERNGENCTFFIFRLQHIFMSELVSAREVFLLNKLVAIPVRLKLPLIPYYPGRVFQKALPLLLCRGLFITDPVLRFKARYFQVTTYSANLPPRS